MATGNGVNQGKTAFLEEFLPENRDADGAAVNQAWRAGGHDDDISGSLVGKTRSRLKIPKQRGATGGAYAGPKASWQKVGDWHDRQRPNVVKRLSGGDSGSRCNLGKHVINPPLDS